MAVSGRINIGGLQYFKAGIRFKGNASVFSGSGAPTSGTSGTGANQRAKGSIYIDYTNGNAYLNTGTKASPSWMFIFGVTGTGSVAPPTVISASGAVSPHAPGGTFVITKAGVAALTLAAPTVGGPGTGDDGTFLDITSASANAHTLTATGLLNTGSAFVNVATFNAQAGASLSLMAYNGLWQVMAANGISFS